MTQRNPNLGAPTHEHIDTHVKPRQERRFIKELQKQCPRCDVQKVSTDENWLFYRIDTARRRGPIKAARLPDVHTEPRRRARDEIRRYPLPQTA